MRRIRLAAATLMVAAGLIASVAAPVSATPPTTNPAERLCAIEGGTDFAADATGYLCRFSLGTLSESEVGPARKLCEKAFKGDFRLELTNTLAGDFAVCSFL